MLRAAVVGGAGVAAGAVGIAGGIAGLSNRADGAPVEKAARKPAGVRLRWLGVAGWQLSFDDHVLWFDPYLSRFDSTVDGGAIRQRPDVIEGLLASGRLNGPPEVIMVSHGHFDHLTDVPYLLNRPEWKQATIHTICTETHRHLLAAMGNTRDVIQASGGEQFSFAGGAYTIQVIQSLHSQSNTYGFPFPGTLTAKPAPPLVVSDLLEGGTLAYLVTIPGRLSLLLFGATNFVERELVGLRPDVVAIGMTFHNAIDRYLERLLTVLGGPRYAMPCHHDDMVTGFDDPALPSTVHAGAVTEIQQAVAALKLRTKVIAPRHLTDIAF